MDPRLLEAVPKGNVIERQRLLQEDPLVLERGSVAVYPETVLHIAAMGGQTDLARELLKLKPDLATRLDKDGFSAIHKRIAREVKKSPLQTQNALLVVTVLIATMTYQAILNPPNGIYNGDDYYPNANISGNLCDFIPFIVPNSFGFFASLAVIILVMDGFPLKALLEIAVRCMATSYVCGLLLIEPTNVKDTRLGMAVIGIIILMDLVSLWLLVGQAMVQRN